MTNKSNEEGNLEERQSSIIAIEYGHLWAYYHRLLSERKNYIDWYLKVVTLPAALVSLLVLNKGEASAMITIEPIVGALVLLVVWLAGMGLFIAYAKESANASKYEAAMQRCRERLLPADLESIDQLRDTRIKPWSFGGIKAWQSSPLVVINSAIAATGVLLFLDKVSLWTVFISLSAFAAAALMHAFVYRYMVAKYQ